MKTVGNILLVLLVTFVCSAVRGEDPTAEKTDELDAAQLDFFESSVRPLLVTHCYSCHSRSASEAGKLSGGLLLDSRDGVRQGGDSGAVLVPGNSEASLLIQSVRYQRSDLQMPPDGPLSAANVAILEKWVTMGAPDPRDAAPGETGVQKAGIDMNAARNLWAFRKPVLHAAPVVRDGAWPKQELDYFVLAALEQRGLQPVTPATRRELIRRASFDLLGLPPTPAEIQAFEEDVTPDAWDRVIERLLASPHYGERWGRYWLDVARYADDQGNSFLTPTPTAWHYRDWVVQALNQDMPYDEFLRLQIAGDEITEPADNYFTRLAGLGFQSLGPQFRKGAAGEARAKADEVEDRVDTLSRGVLGLTVSCARCHDHKFDPIPTRDYYSLAAAWNGVEWPMQMLASPEEIRKHQEWTTSVQQQTEGLKSFREAAIAETTRTALGNVDRYVSAATRLLVQKSLQKSPDETLVAGEEDLKLYFLRRWVRLLESSGQEPGLQDLRAAVAASVAGGSMTVSEDLRRSAASVKLAVAEALQATEASQGSSVAGDGMQIRPTETQTQLLELLSKAPTAPFFLQVADLSAVLSESERQMLADKEKALEILQNTPATGGPTMPGIRGGGMAMPVFVRGNPEQPGELAPPGFLTILSPASGRPESTSFTRLQLAQAIASVDNPLTARVFVNRVWHYHFGRGIVATPGNFGRLGSPPTHPELLDTLAARFMESGWSIKWLHRTILKSATWQLSSQVRDENITSDPANEYLWRMSPRRLDIEAWRDALLSVAGTLDLRIGGPSVDQTNPGLKEVEGFNFFTRLNGFEADDPRGTRRTLYSVISRYSPNATLTMFDFPEPNVSSEQRTATMVPQQQLFVLNSPLMMEVSRKFALRVQSVSDKDTSRLEQAWLLAYGRPPSEAESAAALEFLKEAGHNAAEQDQLTPWEQLAHSLLASNEFYFIP